MSPPRVEVFATADAASRAGADSFVACARRAIAARGRFDVALSGGQTPLAMFHALAGPDLRDRVDWARVHVFWGDDRLVDPTHPRSNFGAACAALLRRVPIPGENVHRIRGELPPDQAAERYARELLAHFGAGVPVFDLIHLGVGEDGHTASLFPGDPALDERERIVLATVDPARDEPRVTLSLPVLLAARRVEVLVLEPAKADVVRAILGRERPVAELPPVALFEARGDVVWLLTRAVAPQQQGPEPARLVVFGGAGDLARRLLLPAVAELEERGVLPRDLDIVAVGRSERTTADYREDIARALDEHAGRVSPKARRATLSRLSFARADATSADALRPLVAGTRPVLAYLALPPAVTERAARSLAAAGLPAGSRIAVEKPLGEDLASARSLNAALARRFPADDVYRIDHFLGLPPVRALTRRRLTDDALDRLLRREHVRRVDILWDETLAVEGRAASYDSMGALRDVVQNHLLHVFALVAMDRPRSPALADLRRAKLDVFAAVRPPPGDPDTPLVVRARYTAGDVDGREVPAYVDQDGVDPTRGAETFVQLTLYLGRERWRDVPFVLRTGKALARDRHELRLSLRPGAGQALAAVLHRPLSAPDPRGPALSAYGEVLPGDDEGGDVLRLPLFDPDPGGPALSAYGEVLRALLAGDPTLFASAAEVEACWRIVEPYLDRFASGAVPLREYPAGSAGPSEPGTSP